MTIQERITKLVEEKQQAIARINQINGAIIELNSIIEEAVNGQEKNIENTEDNDT